MLGAVCSRTLLKEASDCAFQHEAGPLQPPSVCKCWLLMIASINPIFGRNEILVTNRFQMLERFIGIQELEGKTNYVYPVKTGTENVPHLRTKRATSRLESGVVGFFTSDTAHPPKSTFSPVPNCFWLRSSGVRFLPRAARYLNSLVFELVCPLLYPLMDRLLYVSIDVCMCVCMYVPKVLVLF